jgi:hypothetical protein
MKYSPAAMMLDRPAPGWRSLYEDLRVYALNAGAFGNLSVALDVFLCQGMTAWMRAWSHAGTSERSVAPEEPLPASSAEHGPIIELLSDLIFSRLDAL